MAVESAADRLAFLDPDEFGLSGVLTPVGGSGIAVSGIFDAPHDLIGEIDGMEGTSSTNPVFLVRSSDVDAVSLPGAALALTIDGVAKTFTVADPKPDGTGMIELRLHEN